MDTLINLDHDLFRMINGAHCAFMDVIMWWAAAKITWMPLYAFLAWFLYSKFGNQSILMIVLAAVLITFSDQGSVLIKNTVMRDRPCHDPSLMFDVHTINNKCGGAWGFVSSHAANVMALFTYILLLTRNRFRYITWILAAYVLIVSYSRVYMGVHFPADIFGGWIIGILSALITVLIYVMISGPPPKATDK